MSTSGSAAVISAIGMTTPVGMTAAQSCAAIRAGIAAMTDLDVVIETEALETVPLRGCTVPNLTDGYLGLGRWTRLVTSALKDLMESAKLSPDELARSTVYLALPGQRPGTDARVPQMLGLRIAQWLGLPGIEGRVRIYAAGHAAAAQACSEAVVHVQSGVIERAIICGVDSLVEPATLEFFQSKRRIKTDDQIDGFIPGEAAAVILIEQEARVRARALQPMAAIEAAALGNEPVTIWSDEPSPATGLSTASSAMLAQLPDQDVAIQLIVSDLNGETYRAKEFGNAAARALSRIRTKWTLWHAADCIGDTGAASFAVSLCVAARALNKGYARAERAMILGSSDDGLRGAVLLHRVMEA